MVDLILCELGTLVTLISLSVPFSYTYNRDAEDIDLVALLGGSAPARKVTVAQRTCAIHWLICSDRALGM